MFEEPPTSYVRCEQQKRLNESPSVVVVRAIVCDLNLRARLF